MRLTKYEEDTYNRFFGEGNYKIGAKKQVKYKSIIDNDTFIFLNENISMVRVSENALQYVFMLSHHDYVYLYPKNLMKVYYENADKQKVSSYLVKLRDNYKVYHRREPFKEFKGTAYKDLFQIKVEADVQSKIKTKVYIR